MDRRVISPWLAGTLSLVALAVSGAAVGFTLHRLETNALGPLGPLDLKVYMHGAMAIRTGTTLYGAGFSATSPDRLPFTYPPFAAIVMVPLSYLRIGPLAWEWEAVSAVVLAGCMALAFGPLRRRFGALLNPVVLITLTALALLARPVYDDLVYGQVDVLLMGAALLACASPVSRPGRATLVGLAAAIKVVPGIFIVYLILARRWRMAWAAAGAWGGATALAFALRPHASVAYFGHLLWQTGRPGSPVSFFNQSMWGIAGRAHLGPWRLPVIVVAVGTLAVVGLSRSVGAWRRGDPVTAAVLVGLTGVVVSPISWIHELVWLVPAVGILVGDARLRPLGRRAFAAVLTGCLLASLPYVGNSLKHSHWLLAQFLVDSYGLAAAALLVLGLRGPSRPGATVPAVSGPWPDDKTPVGKGAHGVRGVIPVDEAPAAL